MESYFVKAIWDPDASVWVSESNIPGLVIEAPTLAAFESAMNELAPDLLSANAGIHGARVPVEFLASAQREMAVA